MAFRVNIEFMIDPKDYVQPVETTGQALKLIYDILHDEADWPKGLINSCPSGVLGLFGNGAVVDGDNKITITEVFD